jgi:hypothetical protein
VAIVGLIDPDWPERPRRNIFYPPSLLKSLGWPSEQDRRAAADARFVDLLGSAARRTQLFTFTLDEDALVSRSMQLDEVPRARLSAVERTTDVDARVFVDEALSREPVMLDQLSGEARAWAELRLARSPGESPEFHGTVAASGNRDSTATSARPWSVSALETYLDCPFKFFARHVLALEEEPDDEEVMDPRRQGVFVHEVFEQFFDRWQKAGHRAVTPANLDSRAGDVHGRRGPRARAPAGRRSRPGAHAAARIVSGRRAWRGGVPHGSRAADRGRRTAARAQARRNLHDGHLERAALGALRGKADRVDLLEDGTFRLIDYKLGWPPNRARALQLPIYSICAEQQLASHRGRNWTLGRRPTSRSRDHGASCRCFRRRRSQQGTRRGPAATGRHARRDRRRPIPAKA